MLTVLIILLTLLYVSIFTSFIYGWRKLVYFDTSTSDDDLPTISVVVACKDEAQKLPCLLESLSKQSFPNYQLILVNDHSTDSTLQVMNDAKIMFNDLTVISCSQSGKKQALREGIQQSKAELILTTDADCIPCATWVETFAHYYQHHRSNMIIGPVTMSNHASLISQLQHLEFASMVASGGGAAALGAAILCNGANLGFERSTWLRCQSELRMDIPSGDDMFLLQSIKRRGGTISFLKSTNAMVTTVTAATLEAFITQRTRWASKSTAYTDGHIILVSLVVMAMCVMQVVLVLASIFLNLQITYWLTLFTIKLLTDGLFVWNFKSFFGIENPVKNTLILSAIYPIYVLFIGIRSLMTKHTAW